MLLLDVLIRYSTVTLALIFAVLAIRDGWKFQPTRYAALLSIGVAAILLGTAPPELKLPELPFLIVRFTDFATIGLVWWLGLSMFDDNFKLGKLEWTGMAALSLPILAYRLSEFELISRPPILFQYWISALSLILMAHLAYTTIRGRDDDMVENRRKVRVYFVIGLAVTAALTVFAEIFFFRSHENLVAIFRGAVALPMFIWGILWLTNVKVEKLNFQTEKPTPIDEGSIDPRDKVLHDNLVTLMRDGEFYREPGLTIRKLAEQLKTPEHQLRALINKGMGYRNFSGFLNHYRIQAVKDAMAQPENARIPVLTLAMDVGFNSLAPFNRAFRQIVGETPTQYRSKNINKNNDPTD